METLKTLDSVEGGNPSVTVSGPTGGLGLGLESESSIALDNGVRVSGEDEVPIDAVSVYRDSALKDRVAELEVLEKSVSGIQNNGIEKERGGSVSLIGGEVFVEIRVQEKEILLERNRDDVAVAEVGSEVLVGRNGEKGIESVKGAALDSSVMDGGLKGDGPFRTNGVIQEKVSEVAGPSVLEAKERLGLENHVESVGFGKLGLSSGDGECSVMAEVTEKKAVGAEVKEMRVLLPEMERTEEIAVAKDAHVTFREMGRETVSSEALCMGVGEENRSVEKGVLGQENSNAGMQGNELSVTGLGEIEEEEEEQKEEEIDAQGCKFSTGDFVWGRIKGHPWWPGQIYDHSDASDYAAKYRRKGRFLVVYFGNRTFAWRNPSQLRPFREGFRQMSSQSNSTSFLTAVEEALYELGRCVKSEIVCSCVPPEARATLVRPVSVNAGMKEGVRGPQGRIGELSVAEFEPASFIARLRDVAQVVSISDLLELTVFSSRVSAFRWVKGYGRLPMHHEHSEFSAAEDIAENKLSVDINFDCQRGVHAQNEAEEDCISSPVGPWVGKSGKNLSRRRSQIMGDKYQRKKRSMAELMQENMDSELENESDNMKEEEKVPGKRGRPSKKQKKNERIASPSTMMDNEDEVGNDAAKDGKSASSSGKRKKAMHFESLRTSRIRDDDVGNEGAILSSPRIRKKSKYLSPPYTMLGGSKGMVSLKDLKTETSKAPSGSWVLDSFSSKDDETDIPEATEVSQNGEALSKLAGQIIGSPPILKCSAETFQKKVAESVYGEHKTPGSSSPQTPKVNRKTTPVFKEYDASADKMLSEFLSAALDPLYLKGSRSSIAVKGFFTKYRSSRYLRGSDFEIYNKYVADLGARERKPSLTEHDSLGKDCREADRSEGKFGPGGKKKKSLHTKPTSTGKESDTADQSVLKSGSGVRKIKTLSNEHVSLGKDSNEADQSVPKSGSGGRKRKALSSEHVPLGKDSNEVDQSVPKSDSDGRKRKSLSNEHVPSGKDSTKANQSVPKSGSGGKKKKSLSSEHISVEKNSNETDQSEGKSGQKTRKRKDKGSFPTTNNKSGWSTVEKMGPVECGAGSSGVEANPKEANGDNPVAVLLTFAPGFPLPSKKDLNKIFSKFGALLESETVVSRKSGCARVVYSRSSDAEEAFNSSCKSNNTFGPSIVNCQLQHLSSVSTGLVSNSSFHLPPMERGGTVTPPPSSKAVTGPPLRFIQQNLEIMMSMLSDSAEKESSAEKLSPEVRANLAGEINGLLKKVTTLMDSSS